MGGDVVKLGVWLQVVAAHPRFPALAPGGDR
jgi:hypothetical protein